MKLILFALRKPISILVFVAGLFFFGINALRTIRIDIFPALDLPVLYIANPYGGFTPNQMETFFAKQYINVLLYVEGIKSIETKNVQGLTLIKITFYPGTNMAQAAAEVVASSNRAQVLSPPGFEPALHYSIRCLPLLPVGQLLVLTSDIRNNNELADLANIYVRASFTAIPGLLSAAPFGGNIRTVVIRADPTLLRDPQHDARPAGGSYQREQPGFAFR